MTSVAVAAFVAFALSLHVSARSLVASPVGAPGFVAVIIQGESFRVTSRHSVTSTRYGTVDELRNRTVDKAAYDEQFTASLSHLEHIILPLVLELSVGVHVHLTTQPSPYEQDIVRWYSAVAPTFATFELSERFDIWNSSDKPLQRVSSFHKWNYDAVMMLRPDMVIKPYFVPIFLRADRTKFLTPFRLEMHQVNDGTWVDLLLDNNVPGNAGSWAWLPNWSLPFVKFDPQILITRHDAFLRWFPLLGDWVHNIAYLLPDDRSSANPAFECNSIFRFTCRVEGKYNTKYPIPHESTTLVYRGTPLMPQCASGGFSLPPDVALCSLAP
jgi:hypothetical protein